MSELKGDIVGEERRGKERGAVEKKRNGDRKGKKKRKQDKVRYSSE